MRLLVYWQALQLPRIAKSRYTENGPSGMDPAPIPPRHLPQRQVEKTIPGNCPYAELDLPGSGRLTVSAETEAFGILLRSVLIVSGWWLFISPWLMSLFKTG